MVFLDTLPTKERLHRMGLITDFHCVYCGVVLETRNHLFFECPAATSLSTTLFSLNGLRFRHLSWEALFDWACVYWKGKSLLTSTMKIASNALIYILWEERNKRLFQGRSRNVEEMFPAIKEIVGLHLRGRNINRLECVILLFVIIVDS
ncbi:uncharacterized protein LOC120174065 [Hibiscus syriacus]|uniref:uncharacterized protein LOC120174065 n=1 Tax=Hibiscus syriacus TaxID=106335 RepID=UPI001923E5BA|nr:uncharacterized protein LOC120174065 [Hibiscus syriacus]